MSRASSAAAHALGHLLLEPHVLLHAREVRLGLGGHLEPALHAGHGVDRRLEGVLALRAQLRRDPPPLRRLLLAQPVAVAHLRGGAPAPPVRGLRDPRREGAVLLLVRGQRRAAAAA
eukprot:CAMPEP_0118849770 /NCGR_PEP_ID=MMETSP1162-20130426/94133_1 /TAXON_ID=33656 /ORGANISM="Phaeocystis Sp, Strain CCMP2710" /LENGTH=116 /DNA_ID=CAMNT_0006781961 /DNA_START=478 /DNA_END=824 /DNA_ORIENTATION=-